MTNIRIGIDVLTTEQEFIKLFLTDIKDQFNIVFAKISQPVQDQIREEVRRRITSSSTYSSLIDGDLRGELGLERPTEVFVDILNTWLNSLVVNPVPVKIVGNKFIGGMSIRGIEESMRDVTQLPVASFISEGGHFIPWLQWLVLAGDAIIIGDYVIKFDLTPEEKNRSRTGLALMQIERGGNWKVPSEHSGVAGDNFVTRSLIGLEKFVEEVLQREINKAL